MGPPERQRRNTLSQETHLQKPCSCSPHVLLGTLRVLLMCSLALSPSRAQVAPLWLKWTEEVRKDPESWGNTGDIFNGNGKNGPPWISEMYGYVFACAEVGLDFQVRTDTRTDGFSDTRTDGSADGRGRESGARFTEP